MERFRLLTADDIEVKVKQVSAKGAVLLLYKTARTDMDILDETVGAENWKDDYKEIKGNLYCTISIYDKEKSEWIEKWDCGIESREDGDGNEKKGEASDAFKRAGFRWGIGRELYSSPLVWVSSSDFTIKSYTANGKEKFKTDDRFSVKSISYDSNRRVNQLTIVNDKTRKVVYTFGSEPVEKKEYPKLTCDNCSKVIVGYTNTRGRQVPPEELIKQTKMKFGKQYCLDCAKAMSAKEKEESDA